MVRKITISLCVAVVAMLSAWALADPTRGPVKGAVGYSGGVVAADICLPDDIAIDFGGTCVDPAYWEEHNSAGSQWEFWSTNVAGPGTDGVIMSVDDGDDIVDFTDGAVFGGIVDVQSTLYDSTDQLDIGAACTDGHSQGSNDACVGGSFQVDGIIYGDAGATIAGAALDVSGQLITQGDSSYSWDHTPTGFATENSVEVDGTLYSDGTLTCGGDIATTAAADWDLLDATGSALSFDAAGKAGILELDTTNSAEGVRMSGFLTVAGTVDLQNDATLRDAIALYFGFSQDYWFRYDSVGTEFEFRSTDIDGVGTNGVLMTAPDSFRVIVIGEHPASDTAPIGTLLTGPNAWAQASAGANRNGADVNIAAGIRTLQIVCDNFAWATTDIVNITVDGVLTQLTEGTEWNVGANDELTCDDVGAAITTAVATTKMIPDCDTLGGTCYLTPNEGVLAVDAVTITDGGVDGEFASVIEGTDGSVILSTGYEALVVGPSTVTSINQLIVPNGSATTPGIRLTSEAHGLYRHSTTTMGFAIAGVEKVRLDANWITIVGLKFYGKTSFASSGDGIWEMGINAGTQGVRFDAATTDGTLALYDEAGAALILSVAGQTMPMGAANKLYLNATTTKHTQTAGVLDVDLFVADGTAGGQVAIDVSSTTPAEGLSAGETQYGISASITGDAQDDATSVHIVNQVAYTPNGGGGTSYGYYAADTDFDYGFYTTAPTYFGGMLANGVHTETIADDAGGTHATATLTPTTNFILCDCDDAHGCTITMGETGMVSGMRVTIVGETATHCDFADTDGVSNLTAALQMDDDDTLDLVYSVDEWIEVGRADN